MRRRTLLLACGATMAAAPWGRPAAAAPFTTGRFTVQVQGQGPDVILVPGLTCSRDVWRGVVAGLGGRYRVHLVQIAGFAGEPARDNANGPVCAHVAEDLARYITAMRLQRPAIIGHSMGGTIALMLGARHPALLGRAMVVDALPNLATVMIGPGAPPERVRATAEAIGGAMAHGTPEAYRKSLEGAVRSMVLTASARPEIIREGVASDHAVAGHAMTEIIETDLTPELPRITIPVTVVYAWNKADPYTAAQSDQLMHALYAGLRGVHLQRIDDSAHFIFIDQPAKFQAAVATFLAA